VELECRHLCRELKFGVELDLNVGRELRFKMDCSRLPNRTPPLHPHRRTPPSKPHNDCNRITGPRTRCPATRSKERIPKASSAQRMEDGHNITTLFPWFDRRWSQRELLERHDGGDAKYRRCARYGRNAGYGRVAGNDGRRGDETEC
jgi:hypothetical protein